MKFPEGITKKQKIFLKNIYEETLKKNLRSKTKQKAKSVAKAKFYEEAFRIFCEKEGIIDINEEWKRKKKKRIRSINESIDYKVYLIGNKEFIVSTEEKILDKFSNAERSGLLRNMDDEYEQEILFKAKEKYNLRLHPDMYYVIRTADKE